MHQLTQRGTADHRRARAALRRERRRGDDSAAGSDRQRRNDGAVQPSRARRHGAMDTRRHDDGRRHVQQCSEGQGRRPVRGAVGSAGPRASAGAGGQQPVAESKPRWRGQCVCGEASLFVPAGGENRSAGGGRPISERRHRPVRRITSATPTSRRRGVSPSTSAGKLTVYDTLDHRIGGVSQQQSCDASLTFASQRGTVRVSDLPVDSARPERIPPRRRRPRRLPPRSVGAVGTNEPDAPRPAPAPAGQHRNKPPGPRRAADDIFAKIERLAGLRGKGILSERGIRREEDRTAESAVTGLLKG